MSLYQQSGYTRNQVAWTKAWIMAMGNGAEVWLISTHRPCHARQIQH